jgi:4-hydroxybenzoate polyprenyltransferase
MNQLFNHYLRQYYHLAICTFCITAFTYKSAAIDVHWVYVTWVAVVTYILYNFHYLFLCEKKQLYIEWKKNYLFPVKLLVIIYIGFLQLKNIDSEIPALLISFFLSIIYFRKTILNSHALRQNYLLKPLIIGVVFAILTAYIPYLHAGYTVSESLFLSVARCTFIAALSLTFDIGDILEDTETPTVTLPQKVGIRTTKWVATILLLISGLIESYGAWIFLIEFPALIVLFFSYFFAWVLIIKSGSSRPSWYYLFLVDGTMAMPLLFSLI